MNVLVVAAHPDDEVLGVGGTVARHVSQGHRVRSLIVCEGVSMRYEDDHRIVLLAQSEAAARRLGTVDVAHVGFPDQGLDKVPLNDVIDVVEEQLREFEPAVVYTHFSGDLNRDHRVVSESVVVATRPYSALSVQEVLMFETPSSTEWGFGASGPDFHPDVFVDITDHIDAKVEAFLCYEREIRAEPHPRNASGLRNRARHWGSVVNRPAAEAFQLVRAIRG